MCNNLLLSQVGALLSCSVLQGPPGSPGHPGPRGLPGEKVSLNRRSLCVAGMDGKITPACQQLVL